MTLVKVLCLLLVIGAAPVGTVTVSGAGKSLQMPTVTVYKTPT